MLNYERLNRLYLMVLFSLTDIITETVIAANNPQVQLEKMRMMLSNESRP